MIFFFLILLCNVSLNTFLGSLNTVILMNRETLNLHKSKKSKAYYCIVFYQVKLSTMSRKIFHFFYLLWLLWNKALIYIKSKVLAVYTSNEHIFLKINIETATEKQPASYG